MAKDVVETYPLEDWKPEIPKINISSPNDTRTSFATERYGHGKGDPLFDLDPKLQGDPFIGLAEDDSEQASALELSRLPKLRRASHSSSFQSGSERRPSFLSGTPSTVRDELRLSNDDDGIEEETKPKPNWKREDVDGGYGWIIVASQYDRFFVLLNLVDFRSRQSLCG